MNEPILMKSLRSFRLTSTSGHAVQVTGNEPFPCPAALVQDAMAAGCVPVDPGDQPFIDDAGRAKVEFTGDIRKGIILLAIRAIVEENNTANFDGSGTPKLDVISNRLGYTVSAAEVRDLFQQYMELRNDGKDLPTDATTQNIMRVLEASTKAELVELGEEMGLKKESLKAQTVKDLRRTVLVHLSGVAAG